MTTSDDKVQSWRPYTDDPARLMRTRMTGWYDPFKLAQSARDIAVSALLGARDDQRVIEAIGCEQPPFDYSHKEELWIDYVADLGDGFNPTYTVASLLARDTITLGGEELPRGHVLIMGGDQVYPSASREGYNRRLIEVYKAARVRRDAGDTVGDLYAIPGNHDWYDGLITFMRVFGWRESLASWNTKQRRSYFALSLPHHVWLFAVDIQLEANIDHTQIEYFCEIARTKMKSGDRLILCTAEPDWVKGKVYGQDCQESLAFFEERVLGACPGLRVVARIAGDLHHYRRHESAKGEQNIVAGGGGAFLHPTHGEPVDEVLSGPLDKQVAYRLKKSYPSIDESRSLTRLNAFFIKYNPRFAVATAGIYAFLSLWFLRFGFGMLVGMIVFLAGVVFFTDTSRKVYRVLAGLTHGLIHCFIVGAVIHRMHVTHGMGLYERVGRVVQSVVDLLGIRTLAQSQLQNFAEDLVAAAVVALVGALIGPIIMGLYLHLSLNVFKRHGNEAFSALRIQDWKNFLKLHITREGDLVIYPVGVEKVPRRWTVRADPKPGEGLFEPLDRPIEPKLIEAPITVK